MKKECFSENRTEVEISPINILADIEKRDKVYREFLSMLKLENQHKTALKKMGFLETSIEDNLYRSVPKNYIKRRLIAHNLSKKYDLSGIAGFYQEEDFMWCFSRMDGFFVPVFDKNGYIQGLSVHLDKPFNNNQDIWFSSSDKINGTKSKSWVMKSNISKNTTDIILTDNFLLGTLVKETINYPVISFQNISNSYIILNEIANTEIQNITFLLRIPECRNNMDYIINRVFRNLIPLGYNLDIKYVRDFKDLFDDNFYNYPLDKKVA